MENIGLAFLPSYQNQPAKSSTPEFGQSSGPFQEMLLRTSETNEYAVLDALWHAAQQVKGAGGFDGDGACYHPRKPMGCKLTEGIATDLPGAERPRIS